MVGAQAQRRRVCRSRLLVVAQFGMESREFAVPICRSGVEFQCARVQGQRFAPGAQLA
jgi:hypothetical protein